MQYRTVLSVAIVVILVVTVGAVQLLSGRSDSTNAASEPFPAAAPYIEPTVTPELPEADVPGDDIDGLSRYPESVRVAYDNRSSETETTIRIDYVTPDPLELAHEHVLNIVSSFGWTLTGEEFVAGSRSFDLVREGEQAEIVLHRRDGLLVMSIDYTRLVDAGESEPVAEPVVQPAQDPAPPQQSEPSPPVSEAPPSEPSEQGDQVENEEPEIPAPDPEHKPEKEKKEEKEKKDKQDKEEREKKEKKEKDEKQDRPVENNGNRDEKKDKKKDRD